MEVFYAAGAEASVLPPANINQIHDGLTKDVDQKIRLRDAVKFSNEWFNVAKDEYPIKDAYHLNQINTELQYLLNKIIMTASDSFSIEIINWSGEIKIED